MNYRVGDAGSGNADFRSTTVTFDIVVEADTAPAFAADEAIAAQSYFPGQILDMTLPAATGGNGALTYTLTGPDDTVLATALPGATLNPTSRVLSGTLTATPATARAFTYTATDEDDDTVTLSFMIEVFADRAPVFADGETIDDQLFLPGETVALTLPEVADGTGNIAIVYALDPTALPAGLTFNDELRPPTITGTAPVSFPTTPYTYTATDTDTNTGADDSASLEFDIRVEADAVPAFATGAMIHTQTYIQHTVIPTLTFPQATGGNGDITYTLTGMSGGSLPAGLTFDGAARPPTLTGRPVQAAGATTYTYTAADADGNTTTDDTATLTFQFSVTAMQVRLAFPDRVGFGTEPDQRAPVLSYPIGQAITPITFSAAFGGMAPYTYATASGSPPAGLTFDAAVRVLSGTPTAAGASIFLYRVTDSAMPPEVETLTPAMVICDTGGAADGATICPVPAFVALSFPTPPDDQTFANTRLITPLTLPAATGGSGANPVRIYTTTLLPAGLSFDPASREISGTPTALGTTTVNYRVGDIGSGNTDTQSTTVRFDIVVEADTTPAFAEDAAIADQSYYPGQMLDMTLPAATGGNGAVSYRLTGPGDAALATALPGATLNPTTGVLSGAPTTAAVAMAFTYTATDKDGSTDTLMFMLEVFADRAPDFGPASIADQIFLSNAMVALTLPGVADGTGNIAIVYALDPDLPAGLTFDGTAGPPTITGTAPASFATTTYTYTATDTDTNTGADDSASLEFDIRVEADAVPAFATGRDHSRPALRPRPDARHDPAGRHRRQRRPQLHADRAGRRGFGHGTARGNFEPDQPRPVRHADQLRRRGESLHLHGDGQ